MATQNIQPMPAFEPRSEPTSTSARWTRWLERFNTYLLAADIKGHFAKVCRSRDKSRKKPFTSTDDKRQGRRDQKKHGKQQAKAVETSRNESEQESSEEEYVYTVSKEIKGKAHTTI